MTDLNGYPLFWIFIPGEVEVKVTVLALAIKAPPVFAQLPPTVIPRLLAEVFNVPAVSVTAEVTVMESCITQEPPDPLNCRLLKLSPPDLIFCADPPVKVTVLVRAVKVPPEIYQLPPTETLQLVLPAQFELELSRVPFVNVIVKVNVMESTIVQ